MPLDLQSFSDQVATTAGDPEKDPSERIAELRRLAVVLEGERDDERAAIDGSLDRLNEIDAVLGQIDTLAGDQELRREARTMDWTLTLARLRENADLRDQLLRLGFTEAKLEEAGFFSHEQIDAFDKDGTIAEAVEQANLEEAGSSLLDRVMEFARLVRAGRIRRGRGGQFAKTGVSGEATAKRFEVHARPPDDLNSPKIPITKVVRGVNTAAPEDMHSNMTAEVKKLEIGQVADLPDGTRVLRTENGYDVHPAGHKISELQSNAYRAVSASDKQRAEMELTKQKEFTEQAKTPDEAAKIALDLSAKKRNPVSVGGAASHASHSDVVRAGTKPEPKKGSYPPDGGTPKMSPGADYGKRKEGMASRVSKAVSKGVASRGPESPGTDLADTSPTPDPGEPRWAGHASQKELLSYVNEALSQPSTIDTFATRDANGNVTFDESRRALHEAIISKFLDAVEGKPPGEARVVFTGGGYSAGKGSVLKGRDDLPVDVEHGGDALTIDPDAIKAELPEFQALLKEDPEANAMVYEEAWLVSQELQRRAIEKNVNMIVDGISNTSPDDMAGRVHLFNQAGYQEPRVVYVSIPTDEAIKRANLRAEKAKKASDRRFIPEEIMRAVHRDVSATVPGVIQRADDLGLHVEIWDNNQGWDDGADKPIPPVQFFAFDPVSGEEKIMDQNLYDQFLAKASEKIQGVDAPPKGAA